MLIRTVGSQAFITPSRDEADRQPAKVAEPAPPQLSDAELRSQARSLVTPGSILDGIREPIRAEDVRAKLFQRLFGDLAALANALGFGWVSGRNASYVGGGYIYVPTGQMGGDGYNRVSGPGFRPDMNGNAGGYNWEMRTSFSFPDVWLTFSNVKFGTPKVVNQTDDTIVSVEIDNGLGVQPIETMLSIEYYSQGTVESSVSRNWGSSFRWDLSASQSFNLGNPTGFFPAASLTFTESVGGSTSEGGAQSTVKSVQEAQRVSISERVMTQPGARERYGATGMTDHVFVPFSGTAMLECSAKMHGFMRWGGGKRFSGDGNYHNQWSGSGDRRTVDYTLGGKGVPFWDALRDAVTYNSEPWNWTALQEQLPGARSLIQRITSPDYAQKRLSFPVSGVIGSVVRRNVRFATLSSEPVISPPAEP